MAASNGIIPDISYDDGVSTIRLSTLDRKGHILKDQPGGVQYSAQPPQTGYVNVGYINNNEPASASVKQVRPEIISNHVDKGEIIEPVLVREKPYGDEIVQVSPMYDYREHHPPIVPQEADIYRPGESNDSNKIGNHRSNGSDIGYPSNDLSSVISSTSSILKKSGDKRRSFQQKKISWNENVKIREPADKNRVTVTELQKEDHEYNPIDDPKEEVYHRDIPPEPALSERRDIPDPLPVTATTLPTSPPNGGIQRIEEEEEPPSPRRVHPYGAEHFGERDSRPKDEENNKWCMRITICVLIFLLTFAIIGAIVLGLLYAWSTRVDYEKDSEDLRSKLNLQEPPSADPDAIFPKAWYSNAEGAPAYFLVTGTDSIQNQTPSSQRYMTWHRGKPMKVVATETGTDNTETVILGDPLETDNAVFSLLLDTRNSYTASIDGGEEYSLISFSTLGGDLAWTSTSRRR